MTSSRPFDGLRTPVGQPPTKREPVMYGMPGNGVEECEVYIDATKMPPTTRSRSARCGIVFTGTRLFRGVQRTEFAHCALQFLCTVDLRRLLTQNLHPVIVRLCLI
jgi:hypothetical protein